MTSEPQKLPKSYLDPKEREDFIHKTNGNMVLVYILESMKAADANDVDTAWEWLNIIGFDAEALLLLKLSSGSQYIKDMGFNTEMADKAYGKDWLDNFGLEEWYKLKNL